MKPTDGSLRDGCSCLGHSGHPRRLCLPSHRGHAQLATSSRRSQGIHVCHRGVFHSCTGPSSIQLAHYTPVPSSLSHRGGYFRTQTISNEHTIFFSYGLCIVVGQKFCCVVDSIASQLVPFTILLVPSFMSLRAAILFKNAPSKKNVKWILLVIYLTTFPLFVILLIILLESPVIEVPEDLLSEAKVAPPYAELTQLWQVQHFCINKNQLFQIQMFFFGSNLSVICVPITFILRFIMIRKLNSLSSSMSSKTSELHWSFVGVS